MGEARKRAALPKGSPFVKVGDLVRSPDFAKGHYDTEWVNKVLLLRKNKVRVGHSGYLTTWHETQTKPGGWSRELEHRLDTNADDPSRAEATYRVTYTNMQGGGTGHGQHDVYPDGLYVEAVRVDAGEELPETITFYIGGCFTTTIRDVEVLR